MSNLAVRPVGRDVHRTAVRASVAVIVSRLQDILGRDVVAVIVGKQPRQVARWVSGSTSPTARDQQLLRDTFQVVELLSDVEGPEVTRMWFIGMNPQLDDQAPAEAIATGNVRDAMAAARAFVNAG